MERYARFAVLRSGHVLECDLHHRPWSLQRAEARIDARQLTRAAGLQLGLDAPLLHFAAEQDALVWPPRRATWQPLVS